MRNIEFVPGQIYHIYNRGVDKRNIFREDNNRWRCLQGLCLFNDEDNMSNILWQLEKTQKRISLRILKEFFSIQDKARVSMVRIMAYSLMPNHYHMLIEELKTGGISKFMQKFGAGYTRYFNNMYERSGSLFQGPFKAIRVDSDEYLQHLLVYINVMNPAQLVEPRLKEEGIRDIEKVMKFVDEYPWSTHQEYMQRRDSIIIDKGVLGEMFSSPDEYREFVHGSLMGKKYEVIKDLTLE